MIFKRKFKILKISIFFIFTLLLVFSTIKIFKINESNNINIKYVNKIESYLYQKIQVYDYNITNDQYEINEIMFTKQSIVEEIFYYYNDKFNYTVESINIKTVNDKKDIIINLSDSSKQININDFKLIKLTYKQININDLIINYKNNETII